MAPLRRLLAGERGYGCWPTQSFRTFSMRLLRLDESLPFSISLDCTERSALSKSRRTSRSTVMEIATFFANPSSEI